jgi:uncharacterized protein YjbI with pentapeptide repeats
LELRNRIISLLHLLPEGRTLAFAALAAFGALLLAIAVWWLWWRLPKQEAARLALSDAKARADVEDNFRKTISQALGGVVVLFGAVLAYLQFSEQQRASRDLLISNHDLLISNQVSKGFELLGSKEIVVRLGGIYALEGVMNTSDQYRQPVLDALIGFVREGTRDNTPSTPLPTDVQAALTVIGRRFASRSGVDRIDLRDARLSRADLTRADLTNANLTNATLIAANLTGAILTGANLTITKLNAAELIGADLRSARLILTDLTGANLSSAKLDGQKQLDEACGLGATLPTGLTLKPCPPTQP